MLICYVVFVKVMAFAIFWMMLQIRVVNMLYFVGALCNTVVNLQSLFYKSRTESGTYIKYCSCRLPECINTLLPAVNHLYKFLCILSYQIGCCPCTNPETFICDGQIGSNTSARQLSWESTLLEIKGGPGFVSLTSPSLFQILQTNCIWCRDQPLELTG